MIKKLIKSLVAGLALVVCVSDTQAGIIASNIVAGTQVVYTGRQRVWQIVAYGATDNVLGFYDGRYSSNAYTQPAYTRSTNITITFTNLTTNGIFVYTDYLGVPSSTQYMIQTNRYVGNQRTNIAVSLAVLQAPLASTIPLVAGAISTVEPLDLNFMNGITVTATNSAVIILYTRD